MSESRPLDWRSSTAGPLWTYAHTGRQALSVLFPSDLQDKRRTGSRSERASYPIIADSRGTVICTRLADVCGARNELHCYCQRTEPQRIAYLGDAPWDARPNHPDTPFRYIGCNVYGR